MFDTDRNIPNTDEEEDHLQTLTRQDKKNETVITAAICRDQFYDLRKFLLPRPGLKKTKVTNYCIFYIINPVVYRC